MKKIIYIFGIVATTLTSCNKNEVDNGLALQSVATTITDDANRQARPVILGKKLNNPYSIENMRAALDTLKAHPTELTNCMKAPELVNDIEITPTDLYVRFLPQNDDQFKRLMTDTTLILFDYPLDYEKIQTGDYYKDPTLEGKFTWLYSTVPVGYQPPSGIKYEIIQQLFIPEHSPYYKQQDVSAKAIKYVKYNLESQIDYAACLKNLEEVSFVISGNRNKLITSNSAHTPAGMQKSTTVTKKNGLFGPYYVTTYNPEGYIKVATPSGDQPLANIRVRVARYFTFYEMRTDANGKFYCNNSFGKDVIYPNVEYFVFFDGQNGSNFWRLCDNIAGAAILWTTGISIGVHSPDNYSMTFNTSSYFWGECVQHKALNDYMNIARTDGISLPPANLDIATLNSSNYTSSAPLFKNNIDVTNASIIAYFFIGVPVIAINGMLPDLILRYDNNMSNFQKITYFAWHELSHASMVQHIITDKGFKWGSDYWITNVYQQASNYGKNYDKDGKTDHNPYGNLGDANWQIIALSEGWANYREWLLTKNYLFYDKGIFYIFPRKYGYMFKSLVDLGCSYNNIEKSLASYSIVGFRDNLISLYPTQKDIITTTIQPYE